MGQDPAPVSWQAAALFPPISPTEDSTDNSSILPASAPIAPGLALFCLFGPPAKARTHPPVSVIVTHGDALGHCPDRRQPPWAADQLAGAVRDVDFQRPEFFHDDSRLPESWRIGTRGFRKLGPQTCDRGNLVSNFAINPQFGRLVPVPEARLLILADPERYRHDSPGILNILALVVPQTLGCARSETAAVSTLRLPPARDRGVDRADLPFPAFPGFPRPEKARLVNQANPTVWPFDSITPETDDQPAPEGCPRA